MDTELEPADELAQATRMPRSLCAFVLKINGYDRAAARALLDKVAAEIPGWSRLPQGALWKQVQTLAGKVAKPAPAAAPEPEGDEVDLDVEIELIDDGGPDARTRGINDANSSLTSGRLEFRSAEPLEALTLTCPICHTLRRYPADVTPPPACPTCSGALVVTRTAGEEAGDDRQTYVEGFNSRMVEHIRQHIDASFDPGDVQELAYERPADEAEPPPLTGTLEELDGGVGDRTDAIAAPSIDELLAGLPVESSAAPPPVPDEPFSMASSGAVTSPDEEAPVMTDPALSAIPHDDEPLFPGGSHAAHGDEPLFGSEPAHAGADESLLSSEPAASGSTDESFFSSEPAPSAGADESFFSSEAAAPPADGLDESLFPSEPAPEPSPLEALSFPSAPMPDASPLDASSFSSELAPSPSDEALFNPASLPAAPPAVEADNELERALLDADDWRAALVGVPFELDALMAVRKRASRDAARDLADGTPRRMKVGSGDDFTAHGDCPSCIQTWASLPEEPLTACPVCQNTLVRHTALGGEIDEPALTYQSAYNEAMQGSLRGVNPAFAWHLVAEAPGSVHARLGRAADVPPAVAAVAYDVSAGDEAATLELLDWLGPKVPAVEGRSDEEYREAALGALAEIGAEPDEDEVKGRRAAEQLLQQGELARHVEIGPHHLCPSCLQRWPTEGAPPESCVQCGSPLVHERDLLTELGLSGSSADALNARMERHVRTALAPGFEWSQVKGP